MAKKTAKKAANKPAKKAAAPKAKKAPAKAKKAEKAPAKIEKFEIELGPNETKAFDLAQTSDAVCQDLEEAVTDAISQAVRKVFKKHKVTLTQPEALEVAATLFGD